MLGVSRVAKSQRPGATRRVTRLLLAVVMWAPSSLSSGSLGGTALGIGRQPEPELRLRLELDPPTVGLEDFVLPRVAIENVGRTSVYLHRLDCAAETESWSVAAPDGSVSISVMLRSGDDENPAPRSADDIDLDEDLVRQEPGMTMWGTRGLVHVRFFAWSAGDYELRLTFRSLVEVDSHRGVPVWHADSLPLHVSETLHVVEPPLKPGGVVR